LMIDVLDPGISGFFGKVKQKLSKLVETEPDSWDRSPEPSGSYTDSLSNASLPPQVGQLTYEPDSSYSRGNDRDRRGTCCSLLERLCISGWSMC